MSIRPLPEDVAGKIRSSSTVTSLNGVVCGLLKNSLDAGATKVNIYVEYGRGNCTVEDNGLGIVPGDFEEDGGLGKPYCMRLCLQLRDHSSKFPPQHGLHGRQGTFLASLGALSLLAVTSHHHRHNSHNSISIHHGKLLKRQTPILSGHGFEAFDHGTRVSVNDLFGSLPVRVKHRATLFSDRPGLDKEWGCLVHDVVGLLLSWPSGITVSLRESKGPRELRLKPPDNANLVSRTLRYFTQASLADSSDADSWVPVSATAGHVTVKGCISLSPVATRRSQFMSVGILPISNEYGNNILYEEVNKMFKTSDFGVAENNDDVSGDWAGLISQKKGKGADRWPMFYLRVTLKEADDVFDVDDISSHSRGDLERITNLLRVVTYSFLKKHHLRPQKIQLSPDKSVFSTALHRSTTRTSTAALGGAPSSQDLPSDSCSSLSDSLFDGWNRMKVGPRTERRQMKVAQREPVLTCTENAATERLVGKGGKLLRKPFDVSNPPSPGAVEANRSGTESESRRRESSLALAERPKRTAQDSPSEKAKRLKVSGSDAAQDEEPEEGREPAMEKEPSEWLQNILRSWSNPVFEPTQPPVPRINDEAPATVREAALARGSHRCRNDDGGGVKFEAASVGLEGRVSRSALAVAEVIAQVDSKFILLKLPLRGVSDAREPSASCALVMLDQHAADERCRLEELMTEYFRQDASDGILRAVVEPLGRPLIFEVSGREHGLLQRYREHLEDWGIVCKIQPRAGPSAEPEGDGCTVTVTALPRSIIERCRSEPRLLVELMRKEIWRLNDEGIVPWRPRSAGTAPGRASAADFHGCPRGILELLHSRACRSAIMFNDVLSAGECEQLVRRLARCAFPFQCAHGRPSLVPLVDLGWGCRIRGWDGDGAVARDMGSWKRWTGKMGEDMRL
ncbi:dna mismatch repair mlh3 [Trichoderma cornu-damae]|uniref:Dna mismatch repair mlh3 n=1 Tax=Trichoderma cornu-damae TaxID=654480 RepID=A0A9P8QT60_9HYPO|nr:dna mismatch repair mlh3 [Trichoderma cornu-damae]